MNVFKKLRSWYYELWDYIDESEYVLINKKGKVVAIIDRLNSITYTILSHIFTESHDIYATKEEYLRLYPKYAKKHIFTETEFGENYIKFLEYRYSKSKGEFELINEIIDSQDNKNETCTLGYFLKKSMLADFEKLYELLSEMGIHFLLKPINGPWLTEEDIESINTSLKDFYLTYQSLDKLLQAPHDFPKNEILSNEDIVKNLKRKSDCIFFEYEDFAKKAASNEYAQKVYEAYLKFEAICKKMGLIQSQY